MWRAAEGFSALSADDSQIQCGQFVGRRKKISSIIFFSLVLLYRNLFFQTLTIPLIPAMASASGATESMDQSDPRDLVSLSSDSDSDDNTSQVDPAPGVPEKFASEYFRVGKKRKAPKDKRSYPIPKPTLLIPIPPLPTPPNPIPPFPLTPTIPRVRQYQDGNRKEWVVFFRPKAKPLNVVRIASDLTKNYNGVTEVRKVHQNKLRVSVNSAEQANQITRDQRFVLEYKVWTPHTSSKLTVWLLRSSSLQRKL